ncbi:hypothetical protein PSHT_05092 [Puccinia striiformis]|uniref:Uncharacterized protein n=1 Tax=Puccinia striiformis TaxID=27350 RepID=A0A2S4WBI1_9BASI|nr:hypothetical protein PSHT_05092 [Puccinia striiformis]
MKRKKSASQSKQTQPASDPDSESDIMAIDVDADETEPSNETNKRSFVWLHFELAKDKKHALIDPKRAERISNSQTDIASWAKSGKLTQKVQLNSETYRTALVNMIAECNLAFKTVEKPSFRNLLRLFNEEAMPLVNSTNRDSIATHLSQVFIQSQEQIKMEHLAKQEFISFTQDAWTAPNMTAFMGVTAHFINKKFEMVDLTLSIPHVQGELALILCLGLTLLLIFL